MTTGPLRPVRARLTSGSWNDYLRQRSSATETEHAFQQEALAPHIDPASVRVRRLLERPFGSVRWRDETPDREGRDVLPVQARSSGNL